MPKPRKKTDTEASAFEGELAKVIGQINTQYGAKLARPANILPRYSHIPTGVFMLDLALAGGWAEHTASQIVGVESSGKTTLAYLSAAEAQKKYPDGIVAWIDTDNMFDPGHAARLGVDVSRVILMQPESGEQAVDCLEAFARCREVVLVVLDCIASLVPQKIIDESVEDVQVAVVARLTGKMCSKMSAVFMHERKRKHILSFLTINQFRFKVGLVFGDPRIIPGGVQQNYFHMTRVEMKNKVLYTENEEKDKQAEANQHSFSIMKSKTSAGIKNGDFTMIVNPDHPLGFAAIDQSATILGYSMRAGLVVPVDPSKPKGSIRCSAFRVTVKNEKEMRSLIVTDPALRLWLIQQTISAARVRQSLPPFPKDGYLCGKLVKPPAPVISLNTSNVTTSRHAQTIPKGGKKPVRSR